MPTGPPIRMPWRPRADLPLPLGPAHLASEAPDPSALPEAPSNPVPA